VKGAWPPNQKQTELEEKNPQKKKKKELKLETRKGKNESTKIERNKEFNVLLRWSL
jgi:hypothetical protein